MGRGPEEQDRLLRDIAGFFKAEVIIDVNGRVFLEIQELNYRAYLMTLPEGLAPELIFRLRDGGDAPIMHDGGNQPIRD